MKKTISFLMAMIFVLSSFHVVLAAYDLGDLTGDNKVNSRDIALLQRCVTGMTELSEEEINAADINGDGKVNSRDIASLQRHVTGIAPIVTKEPIVTEKATAYPTFTPSHLGENEYYITYNITYNDAYLKKLSDEGRISNSNPQTYISEEGLVLEDLYVDGYNFKGWYTSQTGGERVTEIFAGTKGKKTLYAQWEKVEYTITFDSPDVPWESVTYTVDKGITLTNPYWFGYTFVGWSNDDGFIVTSIKPGTAENITLHANWTSNRNRATSYGVYNDPIIIEDDTSGQFLFIYNIGKIDNVPLSVIEYIGNTQTLKIDKEYSVSNYISSERAEIIANSVSNATTRSSGWTLSKEWNTVYESSDEYGESQCKSEERTDSEGNVVGGNYFVSNSSSGSSYVSTESGGSKASSSKVTTEESAGLNSSYDKSTEKYADAKLGVQNTTELNAGVSLPVKFVDVSAGIKNTTTVNAEVASGRKDSTAFHIDGHVSTYVGTLKTNDSSEYYKTAANQSSTWNSASGYEKSYQTSRNSQISAAISEQISKKTSYSVSDALGGKDSKTESVAGTDTRKEEYSTSLKYSEGTTETATKRLVYTSDRPGYYRLVMAGTVHVYGVVGYDVATASYYTYTFNVLDDERHEFLDYSKDNANFDDCENGIVTFEVPYAVNEYILGVTGKTKGLEVDLDGSVVGFTEPEGFDGTVAIPQYYSVNNGDGTYSAYRTTEIESGAFKGNKNIKTIILPLYVTEIPANAFEGCTNLETVIAYGVTKIGANAFKGCISLKKFALDNEIVSLGTNAFKDVAEIAVMAANPDVANAAINSGAKRITLNVSHMEGTYDNRKLVISEKTEYFAFISDGVAYNNLQIASDAKETFISNVVFKGNTGVPLSLNCQKISLSRVTVDNSQGFALVSSAEKAEISLFGNVKLNSQSENAVISRNAILSKSNAGVASSLNLNGNYLVCGDITNDKMINFSDGKIIKINEDEFESMISSSIVTFDANGGTVSENTKVVYYGSKYGVLPVPTRQYYSFTGWYTEKTGGTKITADTTVEFIANHTLYAQWTQDKITVKFDANGGNVDETSRVVSCGSAIGAMPVANRDYHRFLGWFTTPGDDGALVTESMVCSGNTDITIYAHWVLNTISGWVNSSQLPSDAQIIDTKWSYIFREYTTNSASSLSGWTLYDTQRTSWGGWSGWSTTNPTNGVRNVESRSVYDHTEYHYYRWTNSRHTAIYTYRNPEKFNCIILEETWFNYQLPIVPGYNSIAYVAGTDSEQQANRWVKANSPDNLSVDKTFTRTVNRTEWRYQEPVYTYYYYRDVAREATSDPTGQSNVSNVVKWVQYRNK
ncbi:MAG: InlB B-repeat-containing protein [Clostridia bacterium]|nr:InlB B-repeat-containing protein [Clostridia bacterium]